MAGGDQVQVDGGYCTIGFVAIKGGTAGAVSAGHRTEGDPYNGGVTSNHEVRQPTSSNLIGQEDSDPTFSLCPR